jgi:hypothetical protein
MSSTRRDGLFTNPGTFLNRIRKAITDRSFS